MTHITTIIFDLSEVYLTGLKGLEVYLEEILLIDQKIINSCFFNDRLTKLFHGEIDEDEYFFHLIQDNHWKIELSEIKSLVRKNFREIEGVREIIESLKHEGYRLGILSVHAKDWIVYCDEKFDYHKLFEEVVYSFEIKVSKPEKEAFRHIINLFGESPEDMIFIDDSSINVLTAESLGIHGILFKNSALLKRDLLKFGIRL